MRVDIYSAPPGQDFGEGDQKFTLHLRRFDGDDRMALLDAITAGSFEQIQKRLNRIVCGWKDVEGPQGNPLPFEVQDDKGKITCNLPAFLGSIDFVPQLKVMAGLLAFLQIPNGDVLRVLKILGDAFSASPTTPPAGNMPATASGGSSN